MTQILHLTHYQNLSSILASDGLIANSDLIANGTKYTKIAYTNIQDKRSQTRVPVAPFGTLHDYVPFYFAPRSPMLYTLNLGNVPGYSEGQKPLIYLVSTVERVVECGLQYVFTDGHGIISYTRFYNQFGDLAKVDWAVMKSKMWNDTIDDPDRKRRRQAEFLVHQFFPWKCVIGIGTLNCEIEKKVKSLLESYPYQPLVKIKPVWYFI